MDPVGFDARGNLFVRGPSETPQWGPGVVADPARHGDSGSLPLTINKMRAMNTKSTFSSQRPGHEAVGYMIVLPASAIPGWPAEVPLPADPLWKHDYSASVRRLVREGVNAPLASLFLEVTRSLPPEADGQSRSATEAFLWRRLQTLDATKGRFRLNGALPVAFDGWSRMEVDLLCDELRVAVELDGPQHLADATAYRRDRRKDQLLQENGHLVLRFLAEDVARDLDGVLDAILRALTRRREATRPT